MTEISQLKPELSQNSCTEHIRRSCDALVYLQMDISCCVALQLLPFMWLMFCCQFLDVPAARLIFEVTIEGSARKVITVQSSLLLHNQLDDEVDVRLINQIRGSAGLICTTVHSAQ